MHLPMSITIVQFIIFISLCQKKEPAMTIPWLHEREPEDHYLSGTDVGSVTKIVFFGRTRFAVFYAPPWLQKQYSRGPQ
ncbi:SNF2 family N-terminal domain, partial [Musa troglodytarum]